MYDLVLHRERGYISCIFFTVVADQIRDLCMRRIMLMIAILKTEQNILNGILFLFILTVLALKSYLIYEMLCKNSSVSFIRKMLGIFFIIVKMSVHFTF